MAYPERPTGRKPKASERKTGGKHKVWLSDGSVIVGGRDISPRLTFPWYMAPMYKDARLKAAALRRGTVGA